MKKKNEKKRNEQRYLYSYKKIRIEKFETQNLRKGTVALVLVEDTKVTNKEEGKT